MFYQVCINGIAERSGIRYIDDARATARDLADALGMDAAITLNGRVVEHVVRDTGDEDTVDWYGEEE